MPLHRELNDRKSDSYPGNTLSINMVLVLLAGHAKPNNCLLTFSATVNRLMICNENK